MTAKCGFCQDNVEHLDHDISTSSPTVLCQLTDKFGVSRAEAAKNKAGEYADATVKTGKAATEGTYNAATGTYEAAKDTAGSVKDTVSDAASNTLSYIQSYLHWGEKQAKDTQEIAKQRIAVSMRQAQWPDQHDDFSSCCLLK